MTVSSQISRSGPYSGNGVTTVFDYDFLILSADHLEVIRANPAGVETVLTIGADYSVSGVGVQGGGSVTLTVAPATGYTITILRDVPFSQDTDLENQGAYYPETIEAALDLGAMRDQQILEKLDRAIIVPPSSGGGGAGLSNQLRDNINRLALSADNIDDVAGDLPNVDTVADAVPDITTVAQNIASVIAASGSVLNLLPQNYVGNGVASSFVLPGYVATAANVLVWVSGVRKIPTTEYTALGTTLTFPAPVANAAPINVLVIGAVTMADVVAEADRADLAADAAEAAYAAVLAAAATYVTKAGNQTLSGLNTFSALATFTAGLVAGLIKSRAGSLSIMNGAGDETLATFVDDGAVSLYHNNAKKIETDASGVIVTGRVRETARDAEKWHTVTRSVNTYYQNTTGRMIRVSVMNESSLSSGSLSLTVNDSASPNIIASVTVPGNGIGWRNAVYADVPPGHYYQITVSGGVTLYQVQELS